MAGAAALGLGGWRVFAAPLGWKLGGTPNIVFGVVSDTHLRTRGGPTGKPGLNWPDKYFAAALEYFKKQNKAIATEFKAYTMIRGAGVSGGFIRNGKFGKIRA